MSIFIHNDKEYKTLREAIDAAKTGECIYWTTDAEPVDVLSEDELVELENKPLIIKKSNHE